MLENSNVTLVLSKYYFVYLSIKALNYYIFRLDLNIIKEKINTIEVIKFLYNLRDLKINLRFFDYYC